MAPSQEFGLLSAEEVDGIAKSLGVLLQAALAAIKSGISSTMQLIMWLGSRIFASPRLQCVLPLVYAAQGQLIDLVVADEGALVSGEARPEDACSLPIVTLRGGLVFLV